MYENSTIHRISKQFALRVIKLCSYIKDKNKYDYISECICKQLLRSGTSIGANVRESKAAQSKADFINKLKIALKEGDESAYWIELLHESSYLNDDEFNSIYRDNKLLNATLVRIINSTNKE